MARLVIGIFNIESYPWTNYWTLSGDIQKWGRALGEWAWVGRIPRYW